MDILCICTSIHGQYYCMFNCFSLFIPDTNLNDTKTIFDDKATNLVIINICSQLGSMCHTPHDRNNNFGQNYYDCNDLNHVHSIFEFIELQDQILEIV
jgi:hypothetical protein